MTWKIFKRLIKFLGKHIPGYRIRRCLFKMAGYKIGEQVYIGEDLIIIDEMDHKGRLKIGNRVAIAERVTLVISSYPNFSQIRPFIDEINGFIEIEEDAWLGTGSIILPNIKIGKGAVVGAGSVVTKDVPDYTVVTGNPAKPLKRVIIKKE